MPKLTELIADDIENLIGVGTNGYLTDRMALVVLYRMFVTFHNELSSIDRVMVLDAINTMNAVSDKLHHLENNS